MSGYVTFRMGTRELAGGLDEVREVVRATGIEELAGARAPVTGLLLLRGMPVPVVDLRSGSERAGPGDVLVVETDSGALGLAVDEVRAVLGEDDLRPAADAMAPGLPAYVLEVRRDPAGTPVFVVSLPALAGLSPAPLLR